MNFKLIDTANRSYLECLADGNKLSSEQDVLDLVGACGENATDCVLLFAENLPEEFFHLSTGLAGVALQKFSMYRIRCAAVLTPELVNRGRFQDMVIEANRGNQFRVFYEKEPAVKWLLHQDNGLQL